MKDHNSIFLFVLIMLSNCFNICFCEYNCSNAISVNNRFYEKLVIANFPVCNHIVVNKDDSIYFRKAFKKGIYLLKYDKKSVEIIDENGTDVVEDTDGTILISTHDTICYIEQNNKIGCAALPKNHSIDRFEIDDTGGIHYTTKDLHDHHYTSSRNMLNNTKEMTEFSKYRVWAFNTLGDFYCVIKSGLKTLTYVLRHDQSEAIPIMGLSSATEMIAVDKTNDDVYICAQTGLFYLTLHSYLAKKIENLGSNNIYTVGFDRNGNIFVGTHDKLLKLTYIASNLCTKNKTKTKTIQNWTSKIPTKLFSRDSSATENSLRGPENSSTETENNINSAENSSYDFKFINNSLSDYKISKEDSSLLQGDLEVKLTCFSVVFLLLFLFGMIVWRKIRNRRKLDVGLRRASFNSGPLIETSDFLNFQ